MLNDDASSATLAPLVLTVPGLGNSGAGHWQSLWEEQRADCRRVELGMWDQPHRNTWVNQLNLAIRAAADNAQRRPVVLAAHSLGCLAVASLRRRYPEPNPTGGLDVPLSELARMSGLPEGEARWFAAAGCLDRKSVV